MTRRERYKRSYTTDRERSEGDRRTDCIQRRRSQAFVISQSLYCDSKPQSLSQGRCHDRTFETGSLHRTPRQITTLPTVPNMRGQQPGSSTVVSIKNGSQILHSCGSMGNVCRSSLPLFYIPLTLIFIAGSGKSVIWCVVSLPILPK